MQTRSDLEQVIYQLNQLDTFDNKEIKLVSSDNPLFHLEDIYSISSLRTLLTEIIKDLNDSVSAATFQPIAEFFTARWERIRQSDKAYTHSSKDKFTAICINVAKIMAPILKKSAYEILMPTLDLNAYDIIEMKSIGEKLKNKDLQLHQFVLSDDDTRVIDVFACLNLAEEDGELKHTTLFGNPPIAKSLTDREKQRIIHHSQQTEAYYQACQNFRKFKNEGSIGTHVKQLIEALRKGSIYGAEDGNEMKAGASADIGIVEFANYLEKLTENEKRNLFQNSVPGEIDTIESLWGRLSRPKDAKYSETRFCVHLIANSLESILNNHQELFGVKSEFYKKDANCNSEKNKLDNELKGIHYSVKPAYIENQAQRLLDQLSRINGEEIVTAINQLIAKIPVKNWPEGVLGKLIIGLLDHNTLTVSKSIIANALQWEGFNNEIDKLLNSPQLTVETLDIIIKFIPNKIAAEFNTEKSFLNHLVRKNQISLANKILQNTTILSLLKPDQLGECLLLLVDNKHNDEAKNLLKKCNSIEKGWQFTTTNNKTLHLTVLEEKPDIELIKLLYQNNPYATAKNKENKTAFLIAAERNITSVLDIFLEDKANFSTYDTDQLANIIFHLIKNNHIIKAEKLLTIASKKEDFITEVDKWLKNNDLSPELLRIIIKHFPQKVLERYKDQWSSFLEFAILDNKEKFANIILQNKAILSKHTADQLGGILISLMRKKHFEAAKNILEEYKPLKTYKFSDDDNRPIHAAVLENKPDLELIKLLYNDLDTVKLLNKENKSALLISAEKNHHDVLEIFFEDKSHLLGYDTNQLEQIIFHLIKNNHLDKASILFEIVGKNAEFTDLLSRWLSNPAKTIEHLKFLVKFAPNKLTSGYKTYSTYLNYLICEEFEISAMLIKDETLSSIFNDKQICDVLYDLIRLKKINDAKTLLTNCKKLITHCEKYSGNTVLHNAILDEKPDSELIILLYHFSKNTESNSQGKSAFLISAEKNLCSVLDTFMESKDDLLKYDTDQLKKIIIQLVKYRHLDKAEILLSYATTRKEFLAEIYTFINDDKLSIDLLKLILKVCPQLFCEAFSNSTSCVAYLISQNPQRLHKYLLQNNIIMCKLTDDQLGEILLRLIDQKKYSEAKEILKQRKPVVRYFNNTLNTPLHCAVLEEKPDLELIQLLHRLNGTLMMNKNKETKTPLDIAIEKNHQAVIEILLHNKSEQEYSLDLLGKLIFLSAKNNQQAHMDKLVKIAITKPEYQLELNHWLKNPELTPDLLRIITKYCPNKVIEKVDEHASYLSYWCNRNSLPLVEVIAQDEKLISQFDSNTMGNIIFEFAKAKKFEQAKVLSTKYQNISCWHHLNTKNTALHYAVMEDKPHIEFIKSLIQNNAFLNQKNSEDKTAAMIAVENKKLNLIDLFLNDKSLLAKYDIDQLEKLILLLTNHKYLDKAEALFKHTIYREGFFEKINQWLSNETISMELLSIIIKNCPQKITTQLAQHPSLIKKLCDHNADDLYKPIIRNNDIMILIRPVSLGDILLSLMIHKNKEDMKWILSHYLLAKDRILSDTGNTALHCAVLDAKPDLDLIQLLCRNNSYLNLTNNEKKSAFLLAAQINKPEVINIFLENQLDMRQYDDEQFNEIMLTFHSNQQMNFLLKALQNRYHSISENKEAKSPFNIHFLEKIKEGSSPDLVRKEIKLIITKLLDIAETPTDIVSLVKQLKQIKNIYDVYYKKESKKQILEHSVWEGDTVKNDWIELVHQAKNKIISLLKEFFVLQNEEVIQFLKTPTKQNGTLFSSTYVSSPQYQEYLVLAEIIAKKSALARG